MNILFRCVDGNTISLKYYIVFHSIYEFDAVKFTPRK